MKEGNQRVELVTAEAGSLGGINRLPSDPNSCTMQINSQGLIHCSHPSSASNVPPDRSPLFPCHPCIHFHALQQNPPA